MNRPVLWLGVLVLALVAGLLIVFLRNERRFEWRSWAGALPIGLALAGLWSGLAGFLAPQLVLTGMTRAALDFASVTANALALVLVAFTLGVHDGRFALSHGDEGAPTEIVGRGPYALVRHPFSAAFLLALLGALLAFPHGWNALAFAWAAIALSMTARRRERRLSESNWGIEYRAYMRRTGRFVPRLRASA